MVVDRDDLGRACRQAYIDYHYETCRPPFDPPTLVPFDQLGGDQKEIYRVMGERAAHLAVLAAATNTSAN